MAAPLFTAAVNAAGRTIYRKGGQFVSKKDFTRNARNKVRRFQYAVNKTRRIAAAAGKHLPGVGRELSIPSIARELLAEMGPPIGDSNWVSRVRGSSAKFIDMIANNNQLG